MMTIQMWDYDMLFGDDLIGETQIDLEDRYFSPDYNAFPTKPIEYRQIYHPSSAVSQGTVLLWPEIYPTTAPIDVQKKWDISKKPAEEFEVRVVIWDSEELKMMDDDGCTDGFIKCFFDSKKAKDTDTHFRNQDGKCSWNYRLLLPVTSEDHEQKLTIQGYDMDLFSANDLIGEC
jgi:Ca2+-dependent lipid-binding protein